MVGVAVLKTDAKCGLTGFQDERMAQAMLFAEDWMRKGGRIRSDIKRQRQDAVNDNRILSHRPECESKVECKLSKKSMLLMMDLPADQHGVADFLHAAARARSEDISRAILSSLSVSR